MKNLFIFLMLNTCLILKAQDTIAVKKENDKLNKFVSKTANNGKWLVLKPESKMTVEQFFNEKQALKIPTNTTFKKVKSHKIAAGFELEKHDQYLNNIKVLHSTSVVYLQNGKVERVQGGWKSSEKPINQFKLTVAEIIEIAKKQFPAKEYAWENTIAEKDLKIRKNNAEATYYPSPEQIYFPQNDQLICAFELRLIASNPDFKFRLIIDAESGNILNKENLEQGCGHHHNQKRAFCKQIEIENQINSVDITDKSNINAVENCNFYRIGTVFNGVQDVYLYGTGGLDKKQSIESNCYNSLYQIVSNNNGARETFLNTTNNWVSAVQSLWGLQRTREYFFSKFNRKGWDNNEGGIKVIHDAEFIKEDETKYYNNASWYDGEMKIGNCQGSSNESNTNLLDDNNTLDIIAHEFTHGVVAKESELVYQGESGALNESFADIFGNLTELRTEGNSDNIWYVSEDKAMCGQTKLGTDKARSFFNPNELNHPDTYKGNFWLNTSLPRDNGGVHINSGVQNHFFYLLAFGGNGINDYNDDFNVTGVGIDIAEFLAYQTLRSLTSSSNYHDARIAWLTQATIHYGSCSDVFLAVKDAWNAVGVYDETTGKKLYCNATVNAGFIDSTDQIVFGSNNIIPEGDCTTTISTFSNEELIVTSGNDIIILPNTNINQVSNVILQIDRCDW